MNQDAPCRMISARWARVSTFCTSAGRLPRPGPPSRAGRPVGVGTPRSTQCTTALASPAVKWSAAVITRTGTGSQPALRRSVTARSTTSLTAWCATITTCPGAGQLGRGDRPVQDQVRGHEQQHLVLVAGRLALHAVADDGRAEPGGGQGAQLGRRREGRSTPARQPGAFDLADEVLSSAVTAAGRACPVTHQVPGQGAGTAGVTAGKEPGPSSQ